jgi:hypothetical protein
MNQPTNAPSPRPAQAQRPDGASAAGAAHRRASPVGRQSPCVAGEPSAEGMASVSLALSPGARARAS